MYHNKMTWCIIMHETIFFIELLTVCPFRHANMVVVINDILLKLLKLSDETRKHLDAEVFLIQLIENSNSVDLKKKSKCASQCRNSTTSP